MKQLSNNPYGWIDREGVFYGCNYHEHSICAARYFGYSEAAAESSGYIKIYLDKTMAKYDPQHFLPNGYGWYCSNHITQKQANTLAELGLPI